MTPPTTAEARVESLISTLRDVRNICMEWTEGPGARLGRIKQLVADVLAKAERWGG